jgi:hypothetical protein
MSNPDNISKKGTSHELVLEAGLGILVVYLSTRAISFTYESHTKSTANQDTQQL